MFTVTCFCLGIYRFLLKKVNDAVELLRRAQFATSFLARRRRPLYGASRGLLQRPVLRFLFEFVLCGNSIVYELAPSANVLQIMLDALFRGGICHELTSCVCIKSLWCNIKLTVTPD